MSRFFKTLPSFATDYSGFISVMHGLGGMMIVHDPSGCLGNYTNTDEPRWYHEPQRVYSSLVRELEAVIGDNDGTIEKIVEEIERKRPPFACILGTPVPSLTGCDIVSIAGEVEARTGVRCFGIETDGFRFYDDGIERALDLLYREFVTKPGSLTEPLSQPDTALTEPLSQPDTALTDMASQTDNEAKDPGSVNILGMTPLDYSIYGEKEAVTDYIKACGMKAGAFFGMGDDFQAIKNAGKAELNLVMCAPALLLAEKMKKELGIDYRLGPFCSAEMVGRLVGNKPCGKTLILGEQLCANALRKALMESGLADSVTVATFFKFVKDLSEGSEAGNSPADCKLSGEDELTLLIKEGGFDTVIADPLVENLCDEKQNFIGCPHPAFSSKLYWRDTVIYSA